MLRFSSEIQTGILHNERKELHSDVTVLAIENLTSWFGLMTDAALVDAALRKSGLISNGKE